MDRIQKALDKAREQRQAVQQQGAGSAAQPGPHPGPHPGPGGRELPQEIEPADQTQSSGPAQSSGQAPGQAQRPANGGTAGTTTDGATAGATAAGGMARTRLLPSAPKRLADNRLVAQDNSGGLADTFRLLRTQVLHRMDEKGASTLAVCSANSGEGKSLVACNLAISLALNVDRHVLLVDLDLRRPSIGGYFGLEPPYGLGDYLKDRRPLADCLLRPGLERLVLLPTLRPLQLSSEILSSPKMKSLAEELKNRYPDRIVIYDMPPLLATDDFLSFAPLIESALLVVEENKTPKGDIARCLELIPPDKLLGSVLNKARSSAAGYYYYGYN